jgi:hypothetical protein
LLRIHKLVNDIQMTGLHLLAPPKSPGSAPRTFPLTNGAFSKTLTIREITSALGGLEFMPEQPAEDGFLGEHS